MKKKISVGILLGGKSAEHEVSLQSAKNIIEAIDRNKYDVTLIAIDKQGRWFLPEASQFLLNADDPKHISLNNPQNNVALVTGMHGKCELISLVGGRSPGHLDVIFPILHGPFGEDGTIQGMLKMMDIPFVGAGVLGSSVGMDKDVMKRLLRDAGLPIGDFLVFMKYQANAIDFEAIKERLHTPMFVKPANLGSSVGIHKVTSQTEFADAIADAFNYDVKIIIEQGFQAREIECSVLGNDRPAASVPGEIIPKHDFYSYEAKYVDEQGADLSIPAELPEQLVTSVQALAIKTYQVLCCEGMARVDLFLTKEQKLYVNEINTIPGFTGISMYPKLWQHSGISQTDLIDRLLQLAIDRYKNEKKLKTSI